MSERTPIEKLEDAVHEYIAATYDDSVPTGWLLSYQTSQLVSEEGVLPFVSSVGFVYGMGTSEALALGLADVTREKLKYHMVYRDDDEGEA